MARHSDVAIIGGGIIGLTCAYYLAKAGLSVTVFEAGDFGKEASWAGAGIIPPGNPMGASTPIDQLRAIGSVQFPLLSAELNERTGIDNGYLRCGAIEFLDEDDADVLGLWKQEGIAFERLSSESLHVFEPAIGNTPGQPYLLPGCAQVRNPRHLQALLAACQQLGVELLQHQLIDPHARDISRIGQNILITAGAWSEPLITAEGQRGPGVHPVRGQIVLLRTRTRILKRILMLGKRYVVPRLDGHVLIGSTEEPEVYFEKANTADAVAELLDFAVQMVPELRTAEFVRCWSGLRPGTPDGLPFIGRVPGSHVRFVAAGHFRAGVQLSIGTAQVMTELLTGNAPSVPIEAFALNRTPKFDHKQAFRS